MLNGFSVKAVYLRKSKRDLPNTNENDSDIYLSIYLRKNTLYDNVVVIVAHMNNFVSVSYDNFFSVSGNCLGIFFFHSRNMSLGRGSDNVESRKWS